MERHAPPCQNCPLLGNGYQLVSRYRMYRELQELGFSIDPAESALTIEDKIKGVEDFVGELRQSCEQRRSRVQRWRLGFLLNKLDPEPTLCEAPNYFRKHKEFHDKTGIWFLHEDSAA